jgi:hypothetical protein
VRGVDLYPWLRFYVAVLRCFNGLSLGGLVVFVVAATYGTLQLPPLFAALGTAWALLVVVAPWLMSIAVLGVFHEAAAALADLAEAAAEAALHAGRIERGLAAPASHAS